MFPILFPNSVVYIPSGSELLPNLFPVFWSGRACQILIMEFRKDSSAESRDGFTCGSWFGQSDSDTVMTCIFLLWPGVSVSLPISGQRLRAL